MTAVIALGCMAIVVFLIVQILGKVATARAMGSWVETPAQVTSLQMQRGRGKNESTSFLRAQYRYVYQGTSYHGERISINDPPSNNARGQALYQRLREQRQNHAVVCFVDPHNPQSAVLDRDLRWSMLVGELIFIVLFAGVGVGLMALAVAKYRRGKGPAPAAEGNGAERWQRDARWRDGHIRATFGELDGICLGGALVWNLITWPAAMLTVGQAQGDLGQIAMIAVFPLIGVAFAIAAGYIMLRRFKYGRVILRPAQLPLTLGGWHAVEASGNRPIMLSGRVSCLLSCKQMVYFGSGRNRKGQERILWQHHWSEDPEQLTRSSEGWTLPLRLPLPSDVPAMDEARDISWQLELRAPTTGIDFTATFTLPVLADAPAAQTGSAAILTRAALPHHAMSGFKARTGDKDGGDLEELYRHAGLRRHDGPTALRLVSPALRCRQTTLGRMLLGFIFIGAAIGFAVLFMGNSKDLWFGGLFLGIFTIIGLVVAGKGFLEFLSTHHLEIDGHGIRLRSGLLFPGAVRNFPRPAIAAIHSEYAYSGSDGVAHCRVVLDDVDGRRHRLTPLVGDMRHANGIAADIRRALGLAANSNPGATAASESDESADGSSP